MPGEKIRIRNNSGSVVAIAIENVWLRYNRGKIEVAVCVDGDKWLTVIEADRNELIEQSVDFFAPAHVMQKIEDAIQD